MNAFIYLTYQFYHTLGMWMLHENPYGCLVNKLCDSSPVPESLKLF